MTDVIGDERKHSEEGLLDKVVDDDFAVKVESRPVNSRLQSYEKDISDEEDEAFSKPTWRTSKLKLCAAFFGFFVSGMKDSTTGVILPHLQNYYNISYFHVSFAFLAPFFGYLAAAALNDIVHKKVGRWGVSTLGPLLQLIFYVLAAYKPPFPLFVIGFAISGIGSGMTEGSWNTMCGTMQNSNQLLGLLHGFFGVGGVVCPTVAQAMLSHGLPWNYIYFIISACAVLAAVGCAIAFRNDRAEDYRRHISGKDGAKAESSFRHAIKHKLVPLMAVTLFLYVGAEVTTGGWTTTYMIEVRNGNPDTMGYVSTGYWIGLAMGRIVFGFLTARIGNLQLMVSVYICSAIAMSVLYWVVPSMAVTAIAAGFLGLFIGPLYPTIMAVAVVKLPKHIHVSGMGFAAAFGGGGAAAMPFIAGMLAQSYGPQSVAPLIFASLTGMLGLWSIIWAFC